MKTEFVPQERRYKDYTLIRAAAGNAWKLRVFIFRPGSLVPFDIAEWWDEARSAVNYDLKG